MNARPTLATTLAAAETVLEDFRRRTEAVAYEEKGVLFSEMHFVFSALAGHTPGQILESGRARGQSTLILGLCFPESQIVSVEYRADSLDVPIAEERLRACANITLLYGDARALIPRAIRAGDVVLIDGPKGFRALKLAFKLLATHKPFVVFVHDLFEGRPERRFLERFVPEAFYSDHPDFVGPYAFLDDACRRRAEHSPVTHWKPYEFQGGKQRSYGPTFACVPCLPERSYRSLVWRATLAEVAARIKRSARKRLRKR